jgi:hypothetical protein
LIAGLTVGHQYLIKERFLIMILQVTASEYLGRAETGRSKPMQCACDTADGATLNAYVKYAGFHEDLQKDHLIGEVVANLFALELGLPAAMPCLVTIEPNFVESLPAAPECDQLRVALRDAPIVAFGSIQLTPVRRWSQGDLVHKSQREQATMLYLFDTVVENTDRGLKNPNLLISGFDFKIIDFGHSFQRCHDGNHHRGLTKPWEPGGIANHIAGDLQHIMCNSVLPLDETVLADFTSALHGLEDDKITDYLSCIPGDWGQDTACRIIDFLIEARQQAQLFAENARRVLR